MTGAKITDMKIPAVLSPIITLVLVSNAFPATYYISNHGSDANVGTDPSTAWATLGKLNERTLFPGDAVRLDCSSTFRETLFLDQSGKANALITYARYGTCTNSLPLVSGADVVSTWSPEKVSNFVSYSSTLAVAPAVVFEDSRRLSSVTSEAGLVTMPGLENFISAALRMPLLQRIFLKFRYART